jgi:hypothetical protein
LFQAGGMLQADDAIRMSLGNALLKESAILTVI